MDKQKVMSKKAMSGGMIFLMVVGIFALAYVAIPDFKNTINNIGKSTPTTPDTVTPGKCPSSRLTEVTLNTQEALAATNTNSVTDYFVFEKDGTYITTGNSGSDGQSVFNVECAEGRKYDVLVLNETTSAGSYMQQFEIDASAATFSKSLKTYEFGDINLVSVASSTDPLGTSNISAGLGKTCGFVITFSENETASAYNKPLIMCQTNISSVTGITMSGVTEANAKKPNRVSSSANYKYTTYELPVLLKSTDAAQKISGTITFSTSTAASAIDSMSCKIADQSTWKKAEYQTLKLSSGFLESAENQETNDDIGAPDSNTATLSFIHSSGYC